MIVAEQAGRHIPRAQELPQAPGPTPAGFVRSAARFVVTAIRGQGLVVDLVHLRALVGVRAAVGGVVVGLATHVLLLRRRARLAAAGLVLLVRQRGLARATARRGGEALRFRVERGGMADGVDVFHRWLSLLSFMLRTCSRGPASGS